MIDEQWMIQFAENVRAEGKEHGTHALHRILPGSTPKFDTVSLPLQGARNPLIGLSHVPMATVIYVQYRPADAGINFQAFVFWPNGTHSALFGDDSGPIESVVGGAANFPMTYLTLSRIAWATPLLPDGHSPDNWVTRAAMKDFVNEITSRGLPDSGPTYWHADEILRLSIAKRIAILRRAEDPHTTVAIQGQDEWYKLREFGPYLGRIDWSALDASTLATELGHTDDAARWWTSQGIGCLEQVGLPTARQCLSALKVEYPIVESNLWSMLGAFERAVTDHYVSPMDRMRARWQADDPQTLVFLTREVVANSANARGPILAWYARTDSGRLQQVSQVAVNYAANSIGLDFAAVPDVGPADGILLIGIGENGWAAQAVNREGEHGTAGDSIDDDHQFIAPIPDPEILAALRRTLTGHARFDVDFTPFEWLRRRIMFGVARALEKLPTQHDAIGHITGALATLVPALDADPDDHHGPASIERLLDLTLVLQTITSTKPLLTASAPANWLDDAESGNRRTAELWQLIAEGLAGVRQLQWDDMRVEPLAEAWAIPTAEAEWWRAEGLGPRQALLIPDETESMIRCATVIARVSETSATTTHLRQRLELLFGQGLPVLWSLVP